VKFVQIIEMTTSRYDEMQQAEDDWLAATEGARTVTRQLSGQDRDNPGRYVTIVEFPSYEAAMKNNDLPATQQISEAMMKLCDGPPTFRNLDVISEHEG
jgi:hypothetical protein